MVKVADALACKILAQKRERNRGGGVVLYYFCQP
jgi:hypothetical protein